MVRKLTALVLLSLMMVVTATSHSGVRYCLCLQTIFVGDCQCDQLVSSGDCSRESTEEGDCCECFEKDSGEKSSDKTDLTSKNWTE